MGTVPLFSNDTAVGYLSVDASKKKMSLWPVVFADVGPVVTQCG